MRKITLEAEEKPVDSYQTILKRACSFLQGRGPKDERGKLGLASDSGNVLATITREEDSLQRLGEEVAYLGSLANEALRRGRVRDAALLTSLSLLLAVVREDSAVRAALKDSSSLKKSLGELLENPEHFFIR